MTLIGFSVRRASGSVFVERPSLKSSESFSSLLPFKQKDARDPQQGLLFLQVP